MPLDLQKLDRLDALATQLRQRGAWNDELETEYSKAMTRLRNKQPDLFVARSLREAGFEGVDTGMAEIETPLAYDPEAAREAAEEMRQRFEQLQPAFEEVPQARQALEAAGGPTTTDLSPAGMAAAQTAAQPNIPGIRPVVSGLQQSITGTASLGERILGDQQAADELIRETRGVAASDQTFLDQTIAGTTRSLVDVLSGGGVGALPIAKAAAGAMNEAVVTGKDAGLEGRELAQFVIGQGAIEGLESAAFQRVGLGGLESAAKGAFKTAAKQGLRQGLKKAGVQTLAEVGEEVTIELLQAVNTYMNGVDPEALDPKRLQEDLTQVVAQTVLTMGVMNAAVRATQRPAPAGPGASPAAVTDIPGTQPRPQLPASTPQAVPAATALEQQLIGQQVASPAATGLEQQLIGQQATAPTQQEQDAFFGTGVAEPTIAEEARFLRQPRQEPVSPRSTVQQAEPGQQAVQPTPQEQALLEQEGVSPPQEGEADFVARPEAVPQPDFISEDGTRAMFSGTNPENRQAAERYADAVREEVGERSVSVGPIRGGAGYQVTIVEGREQAANLLDNLGDLTKTQRRRLVRKAREAGFPIPASPRLGEQSLTPEAVLGAMQLDAQQRAGNPDPGPDAPLLSLLPPLPPRPEPRTPARPPLQRARRTEDRRQGPPTPRQAEQRTGAPDRRTPDRAQQRAEIARMFAEGRTEEAEAAIAEIQDRARRDPKGTGLLSGQSFDEQVADAQAEVDAARRARHFAVMDVANLGLANTVEGHGGADAQLQRVADAVLEVAGPEASFRSGGDEMSVLFPPGTNKKQARDMLKQIEEKVGYREIVPGASLFVAGEVGTLRPGIPASESIAAVDERAEAKKRQIKKRRGERTSISKDEAMNIAEARRVLPDSTPGSPPVAERIRRSIRNTVSRIAARRGREEVNFEQRKLAARKGRRVAKAFEKAKHSPDDPAVAASYAAFKQETLDQFNELKSQGYRFEEWTEDGQPYASAAEMIRDVTENKHLSYFPSEGTATDLPADHPMAEVAPGTGGMLYNDVFRVVHDVMGHTPAGASFDIEGEENAWRVHSQTYSDLARGAMTAETRGQSNWVGYGPHGEANRQALAEGRPQDIVFAEQKATLLPMELWTDDGLPPVNVDPAALKYATVDVDGNVVLRTPDVQEAPGRFDAFEKEAVTAAAAPGVEHTTGQWATTQLAERNLIPVGSIIRRMAPRLYGRLKQMQSGYRRDRQTADLQVKKLEKLLRELPKDVRLRALYNWQTGNFAAAKEALAGEKNAAEITETFGTIHNLMARWREQFKEASGKDMGFLSEHFPRQVKAGKYDEWAAKLGRDKVHDIERLIAKDEERRGRKLTTAEKADIATGWLTGALNADRGKITIRAMRQRTVDNLSFEDWQEFYENDLSPAYSYFENVVYATHKARLFGKQSSEESLNETLGRIMVEGKYGVSTLSPYQKQRLRSAIASLFTGGEQYPVKFWRVTRDLGTAAVLLDPSSAAIQFGDLALIAARDGADSTLRAIPAASRERVMTAWNLGLDHISEEYGDHGKLTSLLRKGFKAVGFSGIDLGSLRVNMVSARDSARRLVKRGGRTFETWKAEWEPILGPEQFENLVRDLRNGVNSEIVTDYAYMQASETRPIDMLDMPENFAKYPNARILWQLKGFAMRQFDFIRKRGYARIARGIRQNNPKLAAAGVGELVRTMFMLSLAGATFDYIRDWLLGRDPDMTASMIDGLLYTHLGSLYLIRSVTEKGPGSAVVEFVTPPLPSVTDSIWRDLMTIPETDLEEGKYPTYRSLKYLPFGKTLYSITPEGKTKAADRARENTLEKAATAWADGDIDAARTYVTAYNDGLKNLDAGEARERRLTLSTVRRSAQARERADR